MLPSGRVVFGKMDEVVFGKPAAEAIASQMQRLEATRLFLMVSNSLNRNTDEIDKVRRVLGNRCAGSFDRMPPHTPRTAVIQLLLHTRLGGEKGPAPYAAIPETKGLRLDAME
jgi:maleylacetate reductase